MRLHFLSKSLRIFRIVVSIRSYKIKLITRTMILLSNYVHLVFISMVCDGVKNRFSFEFLHASVEFFRVFLHLFNKSQKGNFWLQFSNVFSETGDSA